MNKIAAIQKRAADLRRTLFASLPLHVRLSHAFSVLADTDLRMLGRSLGLVFIKKRVQGLPDITSGPFKGPALDFPVERLEAERKDPSRFLPPNYLEGFAESLREILRRKYRSEDAVERAMSTWLFYFIVKQAWKKMDEGVPLNTARNLVLKGLERAVMNEGKSDRDKWQSPVKVKGPDGKTVKHRVPMTPMDAPTLDEETPFQMADPKAEAEMLGELSPHQRSDVRRKLETIHEDAPLYLDLLMEGYKDKEIILGSPHEVRLPDGTLVPAGKSLLPHVRQKPMSYQNWMHSKKPRIQQLLAEELGRDLAAE